MMIQINKPRLTIAALLAVCCLYLPQRVAAQSSLQIPTPIKYILDVRDLAPGLYYVRMTVGRVSGLGSFVKIN